MGVEHDLVLKVARGHAQEITEEHRRDETGDETLRHELRHPVVETETLTAADQADEFLVMGLRLREGIDPDRYAALKGRPLNGNRIGMLIGDGVLERLPGGRIAATAKGAPVLNALVAELAA